MSPNAGTQRGFTLLEVLLALGICMLLVSLVYGGIRVGVRSWEASQQSAETGHMQRIGWKFLHHTLSRGSAFRDPRPETKDIVFEGQVNRLTFVAPLPTYLSSEGLQVLKLKPVETASGLQLLLDYASVGLMSEGENDESFSRSVLVENLGSIEIRYYGKPEDADLPEWLENWKAQRNLPLLVQIDITTADGKRWPRITAYPELGRERSIDLDQLIEASTLSNDGAGA